MTMNGVDKLIALPGKNDGKTLRDAPNAAGEDAKFSLVMLDLLESGPVRPEVSEKRRLPEKDAPGMDLPHGAAAGAEIAAFTSWLPYLLPNLMGVPMQKGAVEASGAEPASHVLVSGLDDAKTEKNFKMPGMASLLQEIGETPLPDPTDNASNTFQDVLSTLPPVPSLVHEGPRHLSAQTVSDGTIAGSGQHLQAPFGTPAWERGLEQKISFMLGRQEQHASLHLNPPHLGPLEIHLHLKDDQAAALFVSPHAAVREAIEAAMPRLRESFLEQGMNLAGTWLAADAQSQSQGQPSGRQIFHQSGAQADALVFESADTPVVHRLATSLVNLFI